MQLQLNFGFMRIEHGHKNVHEFGNFEFIAFNLSFGFRFCAHGQMNDKQSKINHQFVMPKWNYGVPKKAHFRMLIEL